MEWSSPLIQLAFLSTQTVSKTQGRGRDTVTDMPQSLSKALEYLSLGPQWNVVLKECKWTEAGEWRRYDLSAGSPAARAEGRFTPNSDELSLRDFSLARVHNCLFSWGLEWGWGCCRKEDDCPKKKKRQNNRPSEVPFWAWVIQKFSFGTWSSDYIRIAHLL